MYSIALEITFFILKIAALWNNKLRLFTEGRKNLLEKIRSAVGGQKNIIWFHTASMGEFEEARPIIEEVRRRYPDRKILLTFFSPSGYEPRKNWKIADWVFYLPMDTASNARKFIEIVRPEKAIFTIGEFWFNYLSELKRNDVDTYIMSVLATPDSPYMKWYGFPYRKLLRTVYRKVMVKTEKSAELLKSAGCTRVAVTGDARFDRVRAVAEEPWHDEITEIWTCGKKAAVAGSTCHRDDDLMLALVRSYPDQKFLFIPHEPDPAPVRHIVESSPFGCVVYSDVESCFAPGCDEGKRKLAEERLRAAQVLVIDKIGMLSRLYRYGWCALIGGGFINMPHSVIEASVYGLPVVMGPQYHKNVQFAELMPSGAAVPVETEDDMRKWFSGLLDDRRRLERTSDFARKYCLENSGATDRIMNVIFPEDAGEL